MATPTTAGNVALIRQYFEEGWYPLGSKVGTNKMTPQGALLKAMLINGGQTLPGTHNGNNMQGQDANTETAETSDSDPNRRLTRSTPTYVNKRFQGFGLVVLGKVLPFSDAAPNEIGHHNLLAIGDFQRMASLKSGRKIPMWSRYRSHHNRHRALPPCR